MIRNFSKKILGDSKLFEKNKGTILRIFNEFSGEDYDNFEDLCSKHNVFKNTTYAFIKNGLVFKIHDQIIDLDKIKIETSLSDNAVDEMEIISVSRNTVITVENLTTFNYLNKDAIIIYLGGFHNAIKKKLLLKIFNFNSNLEWFHFGDIDVNGFVILEDLKQKTNIAFQPLFMNEEYLIKYKNECQSLTTNDIRKLNIMLSDGKYVQYHSVIKTMLDENIKLEQESIV